MPLPAAEPVAVSQSGLFDTAVQVQGLLTLKVAVPPVEPTLADPGVKLYVQAAAVCVTLKVIPAIVREPVRAAGVLFWVTV